MKISKSLIFLSGLVALLALVYAGLGLFWRTAGASYSFTTLHGQPVEIYGQGVYRFDTLLAAAGNRGTDLVTLLFALPLLVISLILYGRGSLKGGLLLTSALAYFVYNSISLTFGAAYNSLVFLYILAFSTSFFAFILACTTFNLAELPARFSPRLPRRWIAGFLFFAGVVTALVWLSDMVPAAMRGGVPGILASYTTVFTYVFDLAIIPPSTILAGVLLLRRDPMGYLLSPVLLVLCTLIGIVVIGQTVFQLNAGIRLNPGQFIGLVGSWVIMGSVAIALTIAFFRSIKQQAA